MEPLKFTKRPVPVEMVQFTPDNANDIMEWVRSNGGEVEYLSESALGDDHRYLALWTPHGPVEVNYGDWVAFGGMLDDGPDFYPILSDVHEATYIEGDLGKNIASFLTGAALADHLGDIRNDEHLLYAVFGVTDKDIHEYRYEFDGSAFDMLRYLAPRHSIPVEAYVLEPDEDDEEGDE